MEENIIIDYEEIFDESEDKIKPPNDEEQKNNSIFTIVLYVVLFLLGAATLFVTPFFTEKDSDYLILEQALILENSSHIYILDSTYINSQTDFDISNIHYIEIDNYVYFSFASEVNSIWMQENFTNILDGSITNWPKNNEDAEETPIIIYISDDLSLTVNSDNAYTIKSGYSVNQNGIIIFITYLLVAIPLVFLNIKKIKFDYSVLSINVEKPFLSNLFSSIILMYAVSIGLGIISSLFAEIFGMSSVSSNQESIDLMLRSKSAFLVILTVTFIGPLVEELVFRSAIFSLIKNSKNAIIVSSIVFGLIHITTELVLLLDGFSWFAFGQMLVFSIPYIGMGVFLSYLYHKNNHNIILLYGVHAIYNLIVSILGLLI
ncbi:MAG TPA: CPBP family intramembrane metalloprotease [Acholeplasma sp.]|nr:CPBP family intramembrane metalloprotease [Acholeplasma sp.]